MICCCWRVKFNDSACTGWMSLTRFCMMWLLLVSAGGTGEAFFCERRLPRSGHTKHTSQRFLCGSSSSPHDAFHLHLSFPHPSINRHAAAVRVVFQQQQQQQSSHKKLLLSPHSAPPCLSFAAQLHSHTDHSQQHHSWHTPSISRQYPTLSRHDSSGSSRRHSQTPLSRQTL